jgi:hypothetical protein
MKQRILTFIASVAFIIIAGCGNQTDKMETKSELQKKVNEFIEVELTSDISHLTENQKEMLGYLFEAGKLMEDIFWKQAYGNKEELNNKISDPVVKEFVKINFGPWERLNNNTPFFDTIPKPLGANYYPVDMTKEEFEALEAEDKTNLYTLIRRDENGALYTIPFYEAYKEETEKAIELITKAASLAKDEGFKKYLELRVKALQTDDYYESDVAWMEMKSNDIDFIVGPIENYEDALYGYKAAHEAFILIKDQEWSKKLDKFAAFLPQFQKDLPVPYEYKSEAPGSDSDLGVYDAVFYAGDCNAGSKTIAINLPNDEQVRLDKGSRKLQLKNSMRAKFDKILVPIADLLIVENQRKHVKFNAFFENTMFHEVAHGLGMSSTTEGSQTVREVLQNYYTSIEEGKADILGLYVVTKLYDMGELTDGELMDNFVTFMAGIFRSARFGVASSHGKANMMRFYFFQEKGAFTRDDATGTYQVDFDKMKIAMNELTEKILIIQGDGNYEEAKTWVESDGKIKEVLRKDLDRINEAGIPRDIRFKQGKEILGLN